MATIRQWVAWVENKIAGLVVGEGLAVGLAEVIEGPQVVTFRLRLLRPSPADLRRLLTLGPAIAQATQVEKVRITDTARGILVELPSPSPKTPPASLLATATTGLAVAVGLDQWRKPVVVNLDDRPNVAFIGPPGRGKTQGLKSVVFALASRNPARRLSYAIFSQKRSDWVAFEGAAGCIAVVSDPTEATDAIAWAAGDLLQGRARDGASWPAVVLILDDLVALLQRAPDLAGPLGEIASMGRAPRVFLLLGTQQAGSRSGMGSTLIDDNVACRIVYRASSATAGARATGAGGLGVEALTGRKGDALFVADDQVERIATGFADDRLVAQLPAGDWGRKPWLSRSATRSIASPRTGQNGSERPERAVLTERDPAAAAGHEAAGEGGDEERGDEERLRLPGNRPPTAAERRQLRELFARLGSKEKVYRVAWGFKNGIVAGWLNEALSEAIVEPVLHVEDQVAGDFDRIDLGTEEGRALWGELQRAGLVKLPDVAALIQEGA